MLYWSNFPLPISKLTFRKNLTKSAKACKPDSPLKKRKYYLISIRVFKAKF